MNANISKKALADALQNVERIIPNRSSNPGTNLLRMDLEQDSIRLSGTNLELDIEVNLPTETSGPGSLALPASVFAQVIRALPGDEVTMSVQDGELSVAGGDFATRLQLVDPANAPSLRFPEEYAGTLPAAALGTALSRVRYAAAVAEYQAIFRGVKLELNNDGARAVATDGFRLAYADIQDASGIEGSVIIPGRTVDEMAKILVSGNVDVVINDAQISLKTENTRINAKLMDGTFPDYQRVIPEAFPVTIRLSADALREAVQRVAVMADKTANNRVDLFIKDGNLQITAEGAYGRSQEGIQVEQQGSDPEMALAFNAKYLTDALAPLEDQLQVAFSGSTSPSVLTDPKDGTYLAMVVPLRTG